MDRLWALRKDHGPWLRGTLFTIVRWTTFRCPYCTWPFKITWGPSNSFLGTGERACWHCKQIFWDGSHEWPEMAFNERFQFLFPITAAGYLAAFLVLAGIELYSSAFRKTGLNPGALIFFVAFSLPLAIWLCFRGWQVIRSVHRYNTQQKPSS
jgi:hypothetical protein